MDPIRNADLFAGQLSGVLMEAASGGGTPQMQRALAERLFGLLDQVASSAPPCLDTQRPEWMAIVGDSEISLLQRSELRIMGTHQAGRYVTVMITPDAGPQWNITCPGAAALGLTLDGPSAQPYQSPVEAATEIEICVVDGTRIVSTHRYLASGEAVNQLDAATQLQSRSQKLQETMDRVTQEGADVPPAAGLSEAPGGAGPSSDAAPGDGPVAGGGADAALGQALGHVGRLAAGVAVAAAAGVAAAAIHRGFSGARQAPPSPATAAPPTPFIESTIEGRLPPVWNLRVLAGPDSGGVHNLKLQTTLGRGTDNDLQILDPEISRNHLRLDIRDDAVVLTDLGSSRGTKVDGVQVERPMPLRAGMVIEAGHSKFVLEARGAPAVAPSPAIRPTEAAMWYYADKGERHGPITETELRQRLTAGLPLETLVWNSGLDSWEMAHSLALCPTPETAPAAPAMEWFFMESGVRQGPVPEAVLRQRLASGLPAETMVWNNTFDTWCHARVAGLCNPATPPVVAKPAPALDAPFWYFMEKEARKGPVSESVLRQRLVSNLPPTTLVWNAQLENWKPAHELGLCAAPVAVPAAPEWFFMDHGVRQGPVAEALLRQRLVHGLSPDTLVWHAKLDDWKPAHALGLAPAPAPAALPTAPAPAPAVQRTCAKCGCVLAPQHRFCTGCGTSA